MSQSWLTTKEVGAALGVRVLLAVAALFGRAGPRLLLWPIALYFVVTSRRVRRVSREYLGRVGARATFGDVYRHVLRFAQCTLDRLFFLRGDTRPFVIHKTGSEHLARLRRSGTGAILLGAHLGSFDALRFAAEREDLRVSVLGFFRNARMLNRFLDEAGPNSGPRFIDIGQSPIHTALQVKKLVSRGEMVAILGDRAAGGDSVSVEFLGAEARFPTGPFALAAALGCPVYLTFGLHYPPNRYELYCEPFVERVEAPRARRAEALAEYAQRYAGRLEHFCRLAPDNWFNFFDFWGQVHAG